MENASHFKSKRKYKKNPAQINSSIFYHSSNRKANIPSSMWMKMLYNKRIVKLLKQKPNNINMTQPAPQVTKHIALVSVNLASLAMSITFVNKRTGL